MRLKNVQAYPIKNVPDHITHECFEVGRAMGKLLLETFKDKDPNMFLGGLTFAYAAIIKQLVSDDPEELKKAAILYAKGLIENIELLGEIKIF
jgi:hypothetical protein